MNCTDSHLPHVTGRRLEPCGCYSDGLIEWGGLMPAYPPDLTGYYRRRGNWGHACCALIMQGKQPDIEGSLAIIQRNHPRDDLTEWPGYIEACQAWYSLHDIKDGTSEVRVINEKDGYCGRYDWKGRVDGKLTRIDWKLGQAPPYTAIQLALYDLADEFTRRVCIELHPDGTFKPYIYNDYTDYAAARILTRYYAAFGPGSKYR
jgi:hypothetical protein